MPRNPENRENIPVLPQEYPLTANGDPFVVFECRVGDQERIFIFASSQGLQFLANSLDWYADF